MRILIVILICCSSFYGRAQQYPSHVLASGFVLVNGEIVGTGFLFKDQYTIISCEHVANRKGAVAFKSASSGEFYSLDLIYYDYNYDYAILRSKRPINAPPLIPGDFDELDVAQRVSYCGYNRRNTENVLIPNLNYETVFIIKKGILFDRNVKVKYIDIVASIVTGYSGGPVVNSKGEVVAMITLNANQIDNDGNIKERATAFSIQYLNLTYFLLQTNGR